MEIIDTIGGRSWPPGHGDLIERIRSFDWTSTPLGPLESWAPELRSAVVYVLDNGFPTALVWGAGLITIHNESYRRILGGKPDALGSPFSELWSEVWPEIAPFAGRALSGQSTFVDDYPLTVNRIGVPERAYFTFSYSPVRSADGTVLGMINTVIETTARVEADQRLRESEQQFRALLQASSDAVYRMSADWSKMIQLIGRGFVADAELPSDTWLQQYIHPDDQAHVLEAIDRAVRSRSIFQSEHRVHRVDGSVGWAFSRAIPIVGGNGGLREWFGMASDITARKDTEAALRQSEERYAFLLKLTDVVRPLSDPVSIVREACRLLAERLHVDRAYFVEVDEVRGIARVEDDYVRGGAHSLAGEHSVADFAWSVVILRRGECHVISDTQTSDLVPEADRAACAALGITACMGAPLIKDGQLVGALCVTDERRRVWAEAEIELIRLVGERIWSAVQRSRAATAMRESELRYRTIVDATAAVVWSCPPTGRQVAPQPAWMAFTGQTKAEMLGEGWIDAIHPDDGAMVAARWREAVAEGKLFECEHRIRRHDGEWRWMRVQAVPIRRIDGEIVEWFGINIDITTRKRAEELLTAANESLESRVAERTRQLEREMMLREEAQAALARSQRMEALGKLTGGIAHDYNNLLTVIAGNLELAEARIVDDVARRALRQAIDAVEMGARLNRRLLSFARRRRLAAEHVVLDHRVREMTLLLRRTLGEEIELEIRLENGTWPVYADPGEIDSAIVNIAVNARDAMPTGGKLVIATSDVTLTAEEARAADVQPGDFVCLLMSDTGHGMTSEVLHRAFEPFFTTKEVGKGTGLGLSSVYGFARQSGGFVKIESQVGEGTTVRVFLPRAAGSDDTPAGTRSEDKLPTGNAELILVVEDNDQVREVTLSRLETLGYTVLGARNGSEAIDILKKEGEIELVLSDVVMPGGMSGYDIVEWVQSHRPDVKVLLTSGHHDLDEVGAERSEIRVLTKPFSRAVLARALQDLLAARPQA